VWGAVNALILPMLCEGLLLIWHLLKLLQFCFRCQRHYVFENFAYDQNCPVGKLFVAFVVFAHIKESTCSAFGFIFLKI
jgi:hypothetical protein